MKVKVWDVVIIGGIIIGIIGCFLPWGRLNPSQFQPGQDVRAGTLILSGIYTFMGLTTAAMFQPVFMVKRKVYMIFVVLISGLVALFVSGNWILQPFEYGGSETYTVLFGAYAALLGAIAVSGMAFLYIAATAEKQRSLSQVKTKDLSPSDG